MLTAAAAAAKSLQSCPTLCDPIDGSPPSSPVPGILQAKTLEWVSISFSNAWKWKVKGKSLSRVRLFATPWAAPYQAPLSMGFSRQKYWSGVPSVKSKTPHCNRHKKYHDKYTMVSLKFPLYWPYSPRVAGSCLLHRLNHKVICIRQKTQSQKRLLTASRWLPRWSIQGQGAAGNEYKVR